MGQGKIAGGEGQLGMVVSGKACLSYKEFLARRGVWSGDKSRLQGLGQCEVKETSPEEQKSFHSVQNTPGRFPKPQSARVVQWGPVLAEGAWFAPWHLSAPLLCADDKAEKGEEKDLDVVTQSEEATAEEDHLGPQCYYNTSKSFFDNISSEPKTSSRWMMWAEERKLNTETFRVSGRFLQSCSFWGGFRGGRDNGATHCNPTSHRAGTGTV